MADWYSNNAAQNTSLLPVARDEYEAKLLARKPATPTEQAVASAADNVSQGNLSSAGKAMGTSQATSSAGQGDLMGTAGGAMMMSGDPVLMGAGLGLSVLSGAEKSKREREERERQAYNERIMNRQLIMSKIASQGIQ